MKTRKYIPPQRAFCGTCGRDRPTYTVHVRSQQMVYTRCLMCESTLSDKSYALPNPQEDRPDDPA